MSKSVSQRIVWGRLLSKMKMICKDKVTMTMLNNKQKTKKITNNSQLDKVLLSINK